MLKISRISIIIILVAVLTIYVRPYFRKIFIEKTYDPLVHYSLILNDFLFLEYNKDSKIKYYDRKGNKYFRVKYQRMLPMIYHRNLSLWGVLPESINGVKITRKKIELNSQYSSIKSKDFNTPEIHLYPLYESASIFTEIEEPDSMFRINSSGIEFIKAKGNKIEKDVSKVYTDAMKKAGFVFPALGCYGNPDPRKPFDEGYFIVDAKENVFHLKKVKNRPFVKNTMIKIPGRIKYIMIEEHRRREYYGIILSDSNEFYLISYNDYKLIKLPVSIGKTRYLSFFMICDMLKRTIKIETDTKLICAVTDNDYKLIDYFEQKINKADEKAVKYTNFVFPLKISQFSSSSNYVLFDMKYSFSGLYLSLLWVFILLLFLKAKGYKIRDHIADIIITGITGIIGLAAFFAVGAYRQGRKLQ